MKRSVGLVVIMMLAGLSGQATELPVVNAGFEAASDWLPDGWEVERTSGQETVGEVARDSQVVHSGTASFRVTLPAPGSVTVVSEPLTLEVGHLYRLRGWIRTAKALSDPTSRFPTAVPACLTMASMPFTNHSPAVGSTSDWTEVAVWFVATTGSDRVRLHLGRNGTATGTAWFDDIVVEKADSLDEWIPPQTVRWFGPAYRFDDRGWIVVHVEGTPYARGYQHGVLLAEEIAEYARKLGTQENPADPEAGWSTLTFMTDAMLLRTYDDEYLTEMRGIADGVRHAGVEIHGRPARLLDAVTLNSVVDLGQMRRAMRVTPNALTGEGFLETEEELLIDEEAHKCSAFVATGPATADGRVVFGQIFMWGGYTGVHWNVLMDLLPDQGHRIAYHTFPGGIHSGADFYISSAGIVVGETTVSQTPYDASGTAQSNRIRKALQYSDSIDDVVEILTDRNNGMYTNDWPIADVTTDEGAIFLLGTHKWKLWRTSEEMAPFGLPGFLWANNNNRDPNVRTEYVAQPDDAPYDLMFSPWNRDVAFNEFYQEHAGAIDQHAGVELWASSPVNRAHACDGKITTSEMAEEMVYLAHFGKVTLRGKYPAPGDRRMPDLEGAEPHLSLGYTTASPKFVTANLARTPSPEPPGDLNVDLEAIGKLLDVDARALWRGTVHPASPREAWFVSGSAAYWDVLHGLSDGGVEERYDHLGDALAGMTNRLLYTLHREEDLAAVDAHRAYDRYGPYRVPRIKGTFALHQLRLLLGNDVFLSAMRTVHDKYAGGEATTRQIIEALEAASGLELQSFLGQWLERTGMPSLVASATAEEVGEEWQLHLSVTQPEDPYRLFTTVEVETASARSIHLVELQGATSSITIPQQSRPLRVRLNAGWDMPVRHDRFFVWRNLLDQFHDLRVVYGTSRQVDANHTFGLDFQRVLADAYTEILPPLLKDCELDNGTAEENDLVLLGHATDNAVVERWAGQLGLEMERNMFRWQGQTHARPDDGLIVVLPSPVNPARTVYVVVANSALQLYRMTRSYHRGIAGWARFRGAEIVDGGYHHPSALEVEVR